MASIRKRTLPSGETRWQLDYRDQAGHRRHRQFKTKKEAVEFETKARSEVAQGVHTPDSVSVTVKEAAELWLQRREQRRRERSTLDQYRGHVDGHIVPLIGETKISRLTAPMVESFAESLLDRCSHQTARKVLVSFKSLMRDAQRRGLVAQNVSLTTRIDAPTRGEEELHFPTKEELREIFVKATDRWKPLLIVAALCGLRASELRGLVWDAVDLKSKAITVSQRADRYKRMGPPKSAAGRREVPMSPLVVQTLREWRLACPKSKARGGLEFVFPNDSGDMMNMPDILRRCWHPLMKECKMVVGESLRPRYRFHDLRHVAASLLIEQGASPKRIQEFMGHSSINVTFDVYGKLWKNPEADQALVSAAEREIFG
ncbi:site-specific integrase [Azospirillum sp.]|uniref:tyrosine-type recombinase/integrase n=1 Tax=Azospirillum sp. TaxID=34012 RepID=UPI00262DEFE0|nr:site-specific integrase [Azospirillum sp.]